MQARHGTKAAAGKKAILPQTATRLSTEHYTLAEALHDAGYATGHFGKWHLGHEPYSPLEHGFDVDVPHWPGPGPAGSDVAPWKFPDFDPDTPDQHIEDRMAQEAIAFMEQHRDEPFFLNYWMFSVHAPFDAKQPLIESMDDAIGTLLDALDRLELSERTIIVLTSDNGGNMYNEVDGTTPTSNSPLRGGKATMFEGGVRVPAIVSCPGVTTPGSRSETVVQSCDFYPTLLELLGLKPQQDQQFDGISIIDALQDKPLARESIFSYFPHETQVPDWLPPSVAIHRGDWKLIRLVHNGDDGAHSWKLFNLHDDVGETNDLAAKQPELVKELDALIEQFLRDTNAVVPIPDPAFDAAVYRREDEGKSAARATAKAGAAGQAGGATSKPVAGWKPSKDCSSKIEQSALAIISTGSDPYMSFTLPKALPAAEYQLELVMASHCGGRGQFFWQEQGVQPPFFRDRNTGFDVTHDGQSRTYRVAFKPSKQVIAVRLDPGQAAGEIQVTGMKLLDASGTTVHAWRFGE